MKGVGSLCTWLGWSCAFLKTQIPFLEVSALFLSTVQAKSDVLIYRIIADTTKLHTQ